MSFQPRKINGGVPLNRIHGCATLLRLGWAVCLLTTYFCLGPNLFTVLRLIWNLSIERANKHIDKAIEQNDTMEAAVVELNRAELKVGEALF